MATPLAPRLVKGGLALLDPQTEEVLRVIVLQYSPDTLSRSLQIQSSGADGLAQRAEPLRLAGPPIETLTLEAAIDATDQLADPDNNRATVELGIFPQLAVLETIVYPSYEQLDKNGKLAAQGQIEIVPPEAPLTLMILSKQRVLPVRLTEFSITEEAFDPNLNPIRASVRLGMRVLSVTDLGHSHKGGSLFMAYLQAKEQLVARDRPGRLSVFNLNRI
jgi:hypothetical protein